MSSIRGHIVELWLKRQNYFGVNGVDPQSMRNRIEQLAGKSRLHSRVQIVPVDADSVPAEWLISPEAPPDRALQYLHGGAWFMGSTNTHRAYVSRLVYLSGVRALVINYCLAPENPFPAGLNDCLAAYEWLLRSGISASKIVVAGDSAGGNLTLALLVALREAGKPLPAGAVALSPATNLAFTGESVKTRVHQDPFFSNMGSNTIVEDYIAGHDLHGLTPCCCMLGITRSCWMIQFVLAIVRLPRVWM